MDILIVRMSYITNPSIEDWNGEGCMPMDWKYQFSVHFSTEVNPDRHLPKLIKEKVLEYMVNNGLTFRYEYVNHQVIGIESLAYEVLKEIGDNFQEVKETREHFRWGMDAFDMGARLLLQDEVVSKTMESELGKCIPIKTN